MARKRLADLLREEAQKPKDTDSDTAAAKTVDLPTPAELDATAASEASAEAPKAAKKATSKAAPKAPVPTEPEEPTAATQELERLTAALHTSEALVGQLRQEITELQTQLKTQTAEAQKLAQQLDQATQQSQELEQELTEAKTTILQLAETNTQLQAELKQAIAPVPSRANLPAKAAPPTEKSRNAPLSQQEIIHRRQAESLAHPIFPATDRAPGQLSEQDLGWVD